mmetsp:Transcript_10079/g.11778  ORF Transcript_10079/g.11778 Transcript_10079/m.11778 type:complete len:338 (-) Transcript_10079:395-1408(-)
MSDIDMDRVDHTLVRKHCIALARPNDHAGQVITTFDPQFDLSKTIFKSLPKGYKSFFQRTKLDMKYDWAPEVQAEVEAAFEKLPKPVYDNSALYKFMHSECDFSIEHADGSFMDHLHFCQDYTATNYPGVSSRVMLLHSIMGVGTNCFPMELKKVPMLQSLVDADEFVHISAFPSVLRLLVHGRLLDELRNADADKLASLISLKCHRLLDNEEMTLTADQVWVQLNFQLIHSLDFLPVSSWQHTSGSDYFFQIFLTLHKVLTAAGKLDAKVEWDPSWMQPLMPGARPNTWRHWLIDKFPSKLLMRLAAKQIKGYSDQVGHSLDYHVQFDNQVEKARL